MPLLDGVAGADMLLLVKTRPRQTDPAIFVCVCISSFQRI